MLMKKGKKFKINVNSHDYYDNNNRFSKYKKEIISIISKIEFLFLLYHL